MTHNRPFEQFTTALLVGVVNRGRYARYGQEFEQALQAELETRRIAERRAE